MIKKIEPLFYGLAAAFFVAIFDQVSKWFIVHEVMDPPTTIKILPIFDIVLVFNRGISFGMLTQHGQLGVLMLIVLAVVIIIALLYWLSRLPHTYMGISLGMIIGGAIGNVIDRVYYGHVIDFLHFHWHRFSFPAFNVADSFITLGAIFIVLENILSPQRKMDSE